MGIANSQWQKQEGRDSDGDKFSLHILVDRDTKRIMGSVVVPTYSDSYSFRAYFDSLIPEEVLDTDQPFVFVDLDAAKAFVVSTLSRAEEYNNCVAAIRKVVE